MSDTTDHLEAALQRGMAVGPKVGGFPYLAEALRSAGVRWNHWELPSGQSTYITADAAVVRQGEPLATGLVDVLPFNEALLIAALRRDQAGETSFPEFLESAWRAGVTHYTVDFEAHTVTYSGWDGQSYEESYAAITL